MTSVRKARLSDIPALRALIQHYVAEGVMLPRTEHELAENIRDFVVAEDQGVLAGCGALQIYTADHAEIRSLAVCPDKKRAGIGSLIIRTLLAEAQSLETIKVFAFTTSPAFFRKVGFEETPRDQLPLKVWKDCLRCPKFHACDEIAMIRAVSPERHPRIRGYSGLTPESAKILLPILVDRC